MESPYPPGQIRRHAAADVEPVEGLYELAGHSVQLDAPDGAHDPALHAVHAEVPTVAEK